MVKLQDCILASASVPYLPPAFSLFGVQCSSPSLWWQLSPWNLRKRQRLMLRLPLPRCRRCPPFLPVNLWQWVALRGHTRGELRARPAPHIAVFSCISLCRHYPDPSRCRKLILLRASCFWFQWRFCSEHIQLKRRTRLHQRKRMCWEREYCRICRRCWLKWPAATATIRHINDECRNL